MEKAYIISRKRGLVVIEDTLFRPGVFGAEVDFELSDKDRLLLPFTAVPDCSMASAEGALKAIPLISFVPNYSGDLNALFEEAQEGKIALSCGCTVEPDGTCVCGNLSPLIEMGLI